MDLESPLYESQYIGAFIFALGLASGRSRAGDDAAAFSLLQQTPGDRIVGDLFATWKGRSFVLEFKRSQKEIASEREKPFKDRLLKELVDGKDKEFRVLADRCHFVVFPPSPYGRADLIFLPYSGVSWADEVLGSNMRKMMNLQGFVDRIIAGERNPAKAPGASATELRDYFNRLLILWKATGGTQSPWTASIMSGFIVNLTDEGQLNLVRFDSLDLLGRRLEMVRSVDRSRAHEIDRSPNRDFDIDI